MKLQAMPYSERMGARVKVLDDHGEAIAILEIKVLRQGQKTVREVAEEVSAHVLANETLGG